MTIENPQNINEPEKRDRKRELMMERHQSAVTALELERVLAEEQPITEYPTSRSPENKEILAKASTKLKPILDRLADAGLVSQKETVEHLANKYIVEKVTAQRVELDLKEQIEADGKEATAQEIGARLFEMRTKSKPIKEVEAIRREGYFILAFFKDEDYFKFIGDQEKEESGGIFHRAMRFPNMYVDVILSRSGWNNRTIIHERQHFINDSIFNDFEGFEQQVPAKTEYPLLSTAYRKAHSSDDENEIAKYGKIRGRLNKVKDELLARVRDGGSEKWSTDFFTEDLYEYLRKDFSEEEQEEVIKLLEEIKPDLKAAYTYFSYPIDARGILVYHLIDIPLIRFPERIKAIVDYYKKRISEFTKYEPEKRRLNPDGSPIDRDWLAELNKLRLEITGESYTAVEIILGTRKSENPEQELKTIEDKLISLRQRYDEIIKPS
ncbi:MAG: hypothetical protein A3J46_02345 [Candidatus Yanofskybacteria bacterium RIFCSPHIGHO2_02_FULL_41_11]|uniref:Uncharacterized protein n=1 Tax=Candidatus Yanofskybacteria bacterium RIFCSPHIGHO2_02_FULL_41_11 TaxID=1802675 RepID=A0A1F8FBE2_9BACT|nr:MAG: hypothetical protein A3J46_02345 [Candidatus Yanofskybacteria bacterium RIFCSPHIGHO2_02_FULL_41_11]